MRDGWAPLWRKLFRSSAWRGASVAAKLVMVWVIGNIRHQRTGTTPAGSVDTTQDAIADDLELSVRTVRVAVAELSAPRDGRVRPFLQVSRLSRGVRLTVPTWGRWKVAPARRPASGEPVENPVENLRSADLADHSPDRQDLPITPGVGDDRDRQTTTVRPAGFADRLITRKREEASEGDHRTPAEPADCGGSDQTTGRQGRLSALGVDGCILDVESPRHGQAVKPGRPQKASIPNGHDRALAHFHQRFSHSYGKPPDLGRAAAVQFHALCGRHGAEEVIARIDVAFDAPPRWMEGAVTWQTIVRQFDRFVRPTSGGRRGSAASTFELADQIRRGGRS